MSTVTYDTEPHVDERHDRLLDDEYSQEIAYVDQINAEHQLWDLQRELNQAKLALQAEIWDLRAENQTLRFNAIKAAGQLEKVIGQILTANETSPYDPTC